MFMSAYSIARLLAATASVSALTGVPEYARDIPRIQAEAVWWETSAIVLPFFAALVLGFGKTTFLGSSGNESTSFLKYSVESQTEKWTAPIGGYLRRLVISVVGICGFLLCLLLIAFVLFKLGIHSG
ncbi:MAG: hypothetical protein ACREQ5_04835 [Candidatus Dormibacteria bacterium]